MYKNSTYVYGLCTYRSLDVIVAESKNCHFGINSTIELKNIAATCDNTGALVS
jgi:hypothetical protein